jgi:hypothetical protein
MQNVKYMENITEYCLWQIFCVVVGLERNPLSLVRISEEQLGSRNPRLTVMRSRRADHVTPL